MQWLVHNWIPLAVGITFLILMRQGGICLGHRRERHQDPNGETVAAEKSMGANNAPASDEPPEPRAKTSTS
jgi:hypothetical protein